MNLKTKLFFKHFALVFFIILMLHFSIYLLVPNNWGLTQKFFIKMYAFLLILSVAHFFSLKFVFKKLTKYAGLLFTALGLLKMGFCILFLFPYLMPLTENSLPFAMNFMVVYFIILTFEVIFILKSMQKNIKS